MYQTLYGSFLKVLTFPPMIIYSFVNFMYISNFYESKFLMYQCIFAGRTVTVIFRYNSPQMYQLTSVDYFINYQEWEVDQIVHKKVLQLN